MKKLVIANRGEIARRVLRSARERGYVVAVISTPEDADALVRGEADDVLEVGSFLDLESIVAAARVWKAGFLHPGYGFLSENADFAERVEASGVHFVGPTAASMRLLGNKESAKKLAAECKVPTLPSARVEDAGQLRKIGIEPPYLVKAAGGGGGRGMRIVARADELSAALKRASEEAASGFGDPTVFVERFLPEPRHIEIQVFGDGAGGGVVLGERECSMQRRYQKVIEEAPSPAVDTALRTKMSEAALALVRKARYRGAGTVEFLLENAARPRFYFLEVNTRLQVEHPVTEEVYALDLVAAQLELAEGQWPSQLPPPESGEILEPTGWAIEARVLAEDPRTDFLPTPGDLRRYREPEGRGIRVDSGVGEGGRVHPRFDSMIAKVIASGATRAEAIDRLLHAVESFIVHGATTNLPFLQAVMRHSDFRAGELSTTWIEAHLEELNRSALPEALERRLHATGFREQLSFALRGQGSKDIFAERFRSVGNELARVGSDRECGVVDVQADPVSGRVLITGRGLVDILDVSSVEGVATAIDATEMALTLFGETLRLDDPRALSHRRVKVAASDGEVRAPMAGKVIEIHVERGATVEEGEVLMVVESMKMQLEVHAPIAGKVEEIFVEAGQILDGPDLMALLV